MTYRAVVWLLVAATLASACSARRMAVRQAIDMSLRALPAYDRETNVDFGGQALAGHIKLLEGLLESAPDDPGLLVALARTYSRYAFGYTQLRMDCAVYLQDSGAQARWAAEAVDFYGRARTFGVRHLALTHPTFEVVVAGDASLLAPALASLTRDEAPALFWTAFAWGNGLACQPITPQTLIDLGKTAIMMHRVVELDERIVCGSAHLYLGSYYSRLPKMWGGDAARAEHHFSRARELDSGAYLPARLVQAEHAWRLRGDTTGYALALLRIMEEVATTVPGNNLDNAVARRKAGIRLAAVDSSFVCDCVTPGYGYRRASK